MHEHVTSVCRAAYYHLKNIHCLNAFLTQETLVTVVHAFVTSRIDYCIFLLYCISDYNINRLQRIQNSAARIVTNTFQPLLCGIGCQQILEMRRLLKVLNLF